MTGLTEKSTRTAEDVVARYRRLDSCVVSDAADALGATAALVPGLGPMWAGARVTGRAVTTLLAPGPATSPPATGHSVHLGVTAIEQATATDVIVVANAGRTGMGSWGGLLSLAASLRGVAGVVTDGALRDVDEARELRFAIFARAATPRTARRRAHEVSCGEPVQLAGVDVRPGDLIVADGTGVLVLPWEQAPDVLARAEELAAREADMASRLRAGQRPSDVLGAPYESMTSPAVARG
jgi:4-hydroxy-4-methyl-2-oxoglutarate aldolase